MRIAAVQHDIVWEDREANFDRLAPQVARAVGAGAELVLLTETFSTGFSMTPGIGEPEGGPSAQFLAGAGQGARRVGGRHLPRDRRGGELPYNSLRPRRARTAARTATASCTPSSRRARALPRR